MIVYHGSSQVVTKPDVYHSRENVDFGKGFYVIPIQMQAKKWAARFKRHHGKGFVSAYELDIEGCKEDYRIMEFEGYTEEWLDFIITCRRMENLSDYDIVIGGVANDKVFNTTELYYEGLIGKMEATKRLRYEMPNIQICIRNQKLLEKYLSYQESEEIV